MSWLMFIAGIIKVVVVVYTYLHAYIYLRFKNAIMGTHLGYLDCLSRTIVVFVSS